jgi:DNA-binding transcriptional ArsR family regulator
VSIQHVSLVLEHLNAKPAPKLIALVLADHADADGLCWPSYRRLSSITGMDERTVRRHVKELIERGVVKKVRTGSVATDNGRRVYVSNAYRVDANVLRRLPSLLSTKTLWMGDRNDHLQTDKTDRLWGGQLSTKPSLNHQTNHQSCGTVDNPASSLSEVLDALFEDSGE